MDRRSFSVFYGSLFNQRTQSSLSNQSWAGDWLFRRERLLIVDQFFRDRKPDLLVLQEVLERDGSSAESDLKIIGRGSLAGYEWDQFEIDHYEETHESEFHAVASGLPVQPVSLPTEFQRYWKLPDEGHLTFFLFEIEDRQIPIFNIEMKNRDPDRTFKFITKTIYEVLVKNRFCPFRVIVAGRIPAQFASSNLSDFMRKLSLKDASEGFCEVVSDCYTANPINAIYMGTAGGAAPSQMDRLLVHETTLVASTSVELNAPTDDNTFVEKYGLEKLWPLERYSWFSTIRLSQCGDDDFL